MENYRLHPIAALVFAIVLPLLLVATVVVAIKYCWAPKYWLLIPGIAALTGFAVPSVLELEKKLISRARKKDDASNNKQL